MDKKRVRDLAIRRDLRHMRRHKLFSTITRQHLHSTFAKNLDLIQIISLNFSFQKSVQNKLTLILPQLCFQEVLFQLYLFSEDRSQE